MIRHAGEDFVAKHMYHYTAFFQQSYHNAN